MVDTGISSLITSLILLAIMIPLNGLLLMISTKIFKLKDKSYKTAIMVTLILGVVSAVLQIIGYFLPSVGQIIYWLSMAIVSIILALWLIKTKYKLDWSKAALVWLVWFLLSLAAGFIIGMIFGIIMAIIFVGAITSIAG